MKKKKRNIFDVALFKRLLVFLKPYKRVFYGLIVAVLIIALAGAARPYVTQQAVDNHIETRTFEGFLPLIYIMVGLMMAEVIFQLLFIYFAGWLGQNVVKDVRVKLFKHILNFKKAYYDQSSVGVLITRAITDMERIADIFGQGLFMIFRDIFRMVVVFAIMVVLNWRLAAIVTIMLPIILYATRLFQKYMKAAFEDVRREVSNLNSFVQERVTGMKILQIFNREDIEYKKFKAINDRHKKAWLRTVWYNSIFFPIAELSTSITLGLVAWYGGLNTVLSTYSSLGDLTAFIMMIPMLFRPLRHIADKFNTLQMGMVAAHNVFRVFDTTAEIENKGEIQAEHLKGGIAFNNVVFSYVPEETVLKNISFQVNPGETVAIVGSTGAGKSTIINLLSRFYEIDSGSILIDDTKVENYALQSLRDNIAVVLQDVFLFADSILNNITLNKPDITRDDVINAAKTIGIHDFIDSLPNGYDYNVKERGAMLSSGQRQLISFLRAYVSNPSILILDEATSSVDSYSEQLIQYATDKITKGRTSIVIAHRLATIKNADRILVMDAGKIVEEGTHASLLQQNEGFYKNLYEAQFKSSELAVD